VAAAVGAHIVNNPLGFGTYCLIYILSLIFYKKPTFKNGKKVNYFSFCFIFILFYSNGVVKRCRLNKTVRSGWF
jgi:hypothetical protein